MDGDSRSLNYRGAAAHIHIETRSLSALTNSWAVMRQHVVDTRADGSPSAIHQNTICTRSKILDAL